jgi:drug/metabolite transporter (DMT)-like permease
MTAAGLTTEQSRRFVVAFVALVAGAVAMGASPVFVRWADVGPYASAFWRTGLALPFLWAWARYEGRNAGPQSYAIDRPTLLAGLFFAADLFFWHLSILATTVANATFLATMAPLFVALGAWLVLGQKIATRILIGLALCVLGGLALMGQSYGFAPERLRGDIYGLATAVFFGAYILAIGAGRGRHGAAQIVFLSTVITALCLLVIALALEPHILPRSMNGAASLLALALVAQVAGQGLLAIALGTLPATFSSLVIFLEAVAAAAFGWILLGEALGLVQALGGLLILFGIWVARPRSGDRAIEAGP